MKNKILVFFLLIYSNLVIAQNINDYGAITSGTWTTTTIWRQWDGSGWNTIPTTFPNSSNTNIWILSNSIVAIPTGGGPYNVGNIIVETGGKLFTGVGGSQNTYLQVWGKSIICNGTIGNGTIFDDISFNIEGDTCTIGGSGSFSASRIRKFTINNLITTLNISMNVELLWNSSSITAIYNAVTTSATRFNVNVNSNCTLTVGTTSSPANLSIDGVDGLGAGNASGTYNVNGTIIVTGIIYATTNNNTTTADSIGFNINANGIIKTSEIRSPNSLNSGMGFNVRNNGKLELTGSNGFYVAGGVSTWGTNNNRYRFLPGSTVEYSSLGNQLILHPFDFNVSVGSDNQYWNLITSGSGNKILRATNSIVPVTIRGDLTIVGSSILEQSINNPDLRIGGNWKNYNQSGFNESPSKSVKFYGNGINSGNAATQTIQCLGGEKFSTLWISKTINASVKLLSSVIVDTLKLGEDNYSYWGIIDLNKNVLTISKSDTSNIKLKGNGTFNRYIICEDTTNLSAVKWKINTSMGNFTIPFGINSSKDTIPFVYIKTNNNNIDTLTVYTYGTQPNNLPWPNQPIAVTNLNGINNPFPDNRDWTVDRFWYIGTTNPPINDSVKFYYNNRINTISEIPTKDTVPENMKAQYWDKNNYVWYYPQQYGRGYSKNYVISPLINVNTVWTLSSLSSPLPIELIEFNGKYYNTGIKLFWSTASETNNDHFDILKSFDGINYFKLHVVSGRGNSNSIVNYEYVDYDVCDTLVYYKLKQVDFNGVSKEYYPIAFKCRGLHIYDDFFDILGRKTRMDYDGIKIYQK